MKSAPYDAVVVLGTKVLADGRPSRVLARRIDHGIALVHAGQAANLVVCGGLGPAKRDVAMHVDANLSRNAPVAQIDRGYRF